MNKQTALLAIESLNFQDRMSKLKAQLAELIRNYLAARDSSDIDFAIYYLGRIFEADARPVKYGQFDYQKGVDTFIYPPIIDPFAQGEMRELYEQDSKKIALMNALDSIISDEFRRLSLND